MAKGRFDSLLNNNYLPLFAFAAIVLTGCFFILTFKSIGGDPRISVAVPILLMAVYLALSVFGRLRLHDEQVGDNLYYMGFLFTLTSLGVSLYQFDSAGSTDQIVRNFGIAITSTIAGIALRIFYNQMRRDVLDIERTTRHELADVARRVRAELENVSREFADFRRVGNQMIEEGFGEIAQQAQKNGEQIRESMERLATAAIEPVQETAAKLRATVEDGFTQMEATFIATAQKIEAAVHDFDGATSDVAKSAALLGKQIDTITAKLEKVLIPEQILKNELGPLVRDLGAIVTEYGKTVAASVQAQQTRTGEIVESFTKVAEKMERSVIAIEKSGELVPQVIGMAQNLARLVEHQNVEIRDLLTNLADDRQSAAAQAVVDQQHFLEEISSAVKGTARDGASTRRAAAPFGEDEGPATNEDQAKIGWWRWLFR